jgi:hypothetical protein
VTAFSFDGAPLIVAVEDIDKLFVQSGIKRPSQKSLLLCFALSIQAPKATGETRVKRGQLQTEALPGFGLQQLGFCRERPMS